MTRPMGLKLFKRDRRHRICPNEECHKNKLSVHFKDGTTVCPACRSELVLVCRECGGTLTDEGPKHHTCRHCEAQKSELRKARRGKVKMALGLGVAVIGVAGATCVVLDQGSETEGSLEEPDIDSDD